mmetsp:Transcript_28839/g.35434  ORF Transcript_28839/g.35434 Transcript_28839/m.35434 type:complete len:538 (-) Transcript_28839:1587-3200(-)|eukprot:CAMPEP_0204827450 /NCGR_PEP_ID=MMETSP1346-20131115/4907_1 /ASSEMBLY_ACC=CAM_ASM_000771 /TAXON_ID=215587 /ORGANISM="Aplanochytrium stocchinoi, Strain GSBS06" /LENGTH=537 /DNA_ID=CAMNT_0051955879 /DNA_START=94 /DNA_END=1707 /DNA_ORIENTATION=-
MADLRVDIEPRDDPGNFGAEHALLLILLLFLCTVSGYIIRQKNFYYLPESGAHMLIGIVAGGFIRLLSSKSDLAYIQFNPSVFFFVLLPPIIFEAGYTMKKKRFFENVFSILCYAILGTFISTFVIGFLTYGAAKMGMISIDATSPLQALLFGSLISSVDPVATLAIIGKPEMQCDPLLYSLVFGESVLNDAVAIVLFHVFNKYQGSHEEFVGSDLGWVLLEFLGISFFSVLVGICVGLVCSLVFKKTNISSYHTYEVELLFLFTFGCFALAEIWKLSGVVALFFFAITLSHYNYYNMSEQSKISSTYVFEALAKGSESLVFLYMGISVFASKATWDIIFLILGIIFCIFGRACNIFPMSLLANLRRRKKISKKMQFVMFFAGLRGAVSYALSTQLTAGNKRGIEAIQTTTMGIIICTTFILGGSTEYVLNRLDMKRGADTASVTPNPNQENAYAYQLHEDYASGGGESTEAATANGSLTSYFLPDSIVQRGSAHYWWRRFDDTYMKPVFGGDTVLTRLAESSDNIELERDQELSYT